MAKSKQLTMSETFSACFDSLENDKPHFLKLLDDNIDLDALIPSSFYGNFYRSVGRNRKFALTSFIWALLIQRIFSIPTVLLLIIFLQYSKELC